MSLYKKVVTYFTFLVVIIYLSFFFIHKNSLFTNVDLGRHLANGKLFIDEGIILKTNYYSYTNPHFSVVNHHWGSGVVYETLVRLIGFKGLTLFNVLIYIATILFFIFSIEKTKRSLFFILILFLTPLVVSRPEIRPESFSYLFIGMYLWLLQLFKNGKIKLHFLTILIFIIQLLWSNLHVYFVIGPFILCVYLISDLFMKISLKGLFNYLLLIGISFLSCLLNPAGIKGVFEPFLLMNDMILIPAEMKNLFCFVRYSNFSISHYYPYYLFDFLTITSFFAILISVLSKKWRYYVFEILMIIFFLAIAWFMQRNMAMTTIILIVMFIRLLDKRIAIYGNIIANLIPLFILIIFVLKLKYYYPIGNNFGHGLNENEKYAATTIKQQKLNGPVFNDFDIGSYLIYYFYKELPVYIDPRPEAYPEKFIRMDYWPILIDKTDNSWYRLLSKYNFKLIVLTNKGSFYENGFIERRKNDTRWEIIFEDKNIIVLKST